MTEEQERWPEALAIDRLHGERATAWTCDRIETLRANGDNMGVKRFTILAAHLDQLQVSRRSTVS